MRFVSSSAVTLWGPHGAWVSLAEPGCLWCLVLLGPAQWEPLAAGAGSARAARQMVCRCLPGASRVLEREGGCARLGKSLNGSCERPSVPPVAAEALLAPSAPGSAGAAAGAARSGDAAARHSGPPVAGAAGSSGGGCWEVTRWLWSEVLGLLCKVPRSCLGDGTDRGGYDADASSAMRSSEPVGRGLCNPPVLPKPSNMARGPPGLLRCFSRRVILCLAPLCLRSGWIDGLRPID